MKIGEELSKMLNKSYLPNSKIERPFKRYDLVFQTDSEGRPITLFMGKKDDRGLIKGERFSRKLVIDKNGQLIKDHWDKKGKAS